LFTHVKESSFCSFISFFLSFFLSAYNSLCTFRWTQTPSFPSIMSRRRILTRFMFWPSTTASLIERSLNACSKSQLVKVINCSLTYQSKTHCSVFYIVLFSYSFICVLLKIFSFFGFYLDGKIAVTAVDSGIRALQFLGLDEQRRTSESEGFVVCISIIIIFFSLSFIFHSLFSALCFCFLFSSAEFEGGSNYHRLLHARDDRL